MTGPTRPMHVVIAGGGIAALEALIALRDHAEGRVRITLIAPNDDFLLKPLRTAEPFSVDHAVRHTLREIAEHFDAELLHDEVQSVTDRLHAIVCGSGAEVEYDALVLTPGARPHAAYAHAMTFGLEAEPDALNGILADLEQGYTHSVAFVVPPGVSWALPLYELALMTAREVRSMGIDDAELTMISPEGAPLAIFGPHPSDAVADLLEGAGVVFLPNAYATIERGGHISMTPGNEHLHADRIVSLPLLEGPRVPGVPFDEKGFIPVDEFGRVEGMHDVYAAGDATNFAVKQGGLACQQADAVAEHLAAQAGAPLDPAPFRPVLRGKLLTGDGAQYLRHDLHGGSGESTTSRLQLWSPSAKVAGRYLGDWLAWTERGDASGPRPQAADVDVAVPLPPDLRTGDDPLALSTLGVIRTG